MKNPSDTEGSREDLRRKIIGLGEKSFRKSYYPELQKQLDRLEQFKFLLDNASLWSSSMRRAGSSSTSTLRRRDCSLGRRRSFSACCSKCPLQGRRGGKCGRM